MECELARVIRRTVVCATQDALHRLSYVEWGNLRSARTLVCVHGLTRCARDFDALARALLPGFRVVCVDLPGRGDSDWLADPMQYVLPTYLNDVVTLIARLDVDAVDWVGTSLGGLVGMALAARAGAPIRRLVVNDAGPVVKAAALERIASYVGKAPTFSDLAEAERYIRSVSAPFGPHTDAEWRFMTESMLRPAGDGRLRLHYDPAIAVAYNIQQPFKDLESWSAWDAIRCPTLVLRGAESDLLTRETADEMMRRGPRARLVEFAGVGHAPTLMHEDQIAPVREFLLEE